MNTIERFWLANNIKTSSLLTWEDFNSKIQGKKLILVGGGQVAGEFIKEYGSKYKVDFIVDSNKNKFGQKIYGVKIVSELELKNMKEDFLILVTSTRYNEELKNKFQGIYKDKVFSFLDMEIKRLQRFKWLYKIKYTISSPDSVFRNTVVFTFFAWLRILHFPGFYTSDEKRIKSLKNIYKGKRCFIIAPGPSLSKEDVKKLEGEFTFAVNRAFKIFNDLDWKPNYYVLLDPRNIAKYRGEELNFNINECASDKIFLTDTLRKDVIEKDTEKILHIYTSHLDQATKTVRNPKIRYSDNLLWGHYSANTVTNFAINIADYMGFKEIYLLGTDCNYLGEKQYFDNANNPDAFDTNTSIEIRNGQIAGYEIIKKATEKRGVKVYNATRGGALEVFERVDFDSLF